MAHKKSLKIIGLSCLFHDSAAALIIDDKVVAAAAEERFSRIKHDSSFPFKALEWLLQSNNIAYNELDAIVFYEKPLVKFERVLSQHLQHFPKSLPTFMQTTSSWLNQKLNVKKTLREQCEYYGPLLFAPHHLAHAASSYYLSGFDDAALITVDGVGEWATTTIGHAQKNTITLEKEIRFPYSIGLLYSTITAYLGFRVNYDEYKVMGLAAYGDPCPFQKHFRKLVQLHPDGSYQLNMHYFDFDWAQHMPNPAMEKLFGKPIRKSDEPIQHFHAAIAAALQERTEQAVFNLARAAHRQHPSDNLCFAGGVALNSLMNGKLLKKTPFKNLFIPPDPSDAGGALGAALHGSFAIMNNPNILKKSDERILISDQKPNYSNVEPTSQRKQSEIRHKLANSFSPYLGPGYDWYQIESSLTQEGLGYQVLKRDQLIKKTAQELADGNVVAWFNGKMEWGPRALGNRSILAAATSAEMKELINVKVKKREPFRPFAPVIRTEKARDYFETDTPLPQSADYMVVVYPFHQQIIDDNLVPAVVHQDGSGRLQTVSRKDNPDYYDLLEKYEQLTGIKCFINTSLNIQEPIVCSVADVISTFKRSEMDVLVVGKYLVSKKY